MRIILLLLVLFNSCNSYHCIDLEDQNLFGRYNARNSSAFLILNKNKTYQYHAPKNHFEGEWETSDNKVCEILFKNWKTDTKNIIDYFYIIKEGNELIFSFDDPMKNFIKQE